MQSSSRPESAARDVLNQQQSIPRASGAGLTCEQVAAIVQSLEHGNDTMWRTQRSAVRHELLCRALIWRPGNNSAGEPVHAQLVNLSTGGVGLLVGAAFDANERLVFETTIEGIGPIQWKCVSIWCAPTIDGLFRLGAQFTETILTSD